MTDNIVINFFNKLTDLIFLNLLIVVFSLPVVTAGAAITAAYYVTQTSIRLGDGYIWQRFFKSFRENLRQVTPVWLLCLVFAGGLGYACLFWTMVGGSLGKGMLLVTGAAAILLYLILQWFFPLCSKTSGSTRELIHNAAALAIGYLPYTMAATAVTVLFAYINYTTFAANLLMFLLGFASLIYIRSFFYYKVLLRYTGEVLDVSLEQRDMEESSETGEAL